jgi:phosphatidylserine/phosphatidylglycerophosphate/cardiolipin synthase-like enzyme
MANPIFYYNYSKKGRDLKKILFFILATLLFSSEIYFMPYNGKSAENRLFYLFSHAKKDIKITMYTFTNKKLAKALKIASKKGVKIFIVADRKESKYQRSVIPNLATIKNINIYLLSGKKYKDGEKAKMHVKLAIVDDKYLITGSANYSYSAFYKNYEYIIINTDENMIKKFDYFFNDLKNAAKPYRLSR